ncbi:hypothetical protein GEMRC1_011974 [Eukaryota sp. GEM-RC1]
MDAEEKLLVQLCPCVHPRCMCEGSCPGNLLLDDFCPACSHPVHEHGNIRNLTTDQRTQLVRHASALRRLNMSILDQPFESLVQRTEHISAIRSILTSTVAGSVFTDFPLPPDKEPPYELPTLSEVFRNFPILYPSSTPEVTLCNIFRAFSSLLNDFKLPPTVSSDVTQEEWDNMSRLWIKWKYQGHALVDCFGPRFFCASFTDIQKYLKHLNGKNQTLTHIITVFDILGQELRSLYSSPLIDPDITDPNHLQRFYPYYPVPLEFSVPMKTQPTKSKTVKEEPKTEDLDQTVVEVPENRKRLASSVSTTCTELKKVKIEDDEPSCTIKIDPQPEEFRNYIPNLVVPTPETPRAPINLQKSFKSRDERAKELEDSGKLSFRLIKNDGSMEMLKLLNEYSNIIFEMLPNMPKEYIIRLVFDYSHRVLLVEQMEPVSVNSSLPPQKVLIGGVCFKPHEPQGLIEIVFLAITERIRKTGHGTRLMNHMKDWAIKESFQFILTYADDSAIGYFQKQGFTKKITMPRDRYGGWIKDYNGATLMECILYKQYDWLAIPEMLRAQIKYINQRLADDNFPQRIRFPVTQCVKTDIKALQRTDRAVFGVGNTNRRNSIFCTPVYPHVAEIPCLQGTEISDDHKNLSSKLTAEEDVLFLHQKLEEIYEELSRYNEERCERIFSISVPDHNITHYYDSVKDPVDLRLIRVRLDSKKYYRTPHIFWADVARMCENAASFNAKTAFGKIAGNMLQKAKRLVPDRLSFLDFKIGE